MKKCQNAILDSKVGLQDRTLQLLYGTALGRRLLKVLISPWVSRAGGSIMNSRVSAIAVKPYVKANKIDLSGCEKSKYRSFNDFFTRKLKKSSRPFDMNINHVVSPCDSRLSVYPISDHSLFTIKNSIYTLNQLLQDKKLAKKYQGGTLWLYRLCVDDYHRYAYPVSGRKSVQKEIRGVFHTVMPIADEHFLIYKENTREYCVIQSEECGTILMMEVGAMMVGRIENRVWKSTLVKRGEEKGNFAFGGSTIIVLTQKGKAEPLPVICENSRKGIETRVKLGEMVGIVTDYFL